MISIIVPVYNAEQYLKRCVDSILASACGDFEILLINDGSTDNSPRICEDCAAKDKRITVIHQDNQGVSAARNKGINACQGDWVVFVDADDYISPDFLEMIAQAPCRDLDMLQFDFARQPQFVTDIPCAATNLSQAIPTDQVSSTATGQTPSMDLDSSSATGQTSSMDPDSSSATGQIPSMDPDSSSATGQTPSMDPDSSSATGQIPSMDPAPFTYPCQTLSFRGDQMQQLIRRILVPRQLLPEGNTDFRSPCLRAYRRTILHQHGIRFAPHLAVGEDLLFNLEYHLKATSCVYIPRPVYYYDVHTGSATHSFRGGLMQNHARLQEDVRDILTQNSLFPLYEEDFYSYCLENLTYVLIREIFHPLSTRSYRDNRALCRLLRQNKTYRQAMRHNFRCGILPRKILVLCFKLRLYLPTCLISRISFHYLEGKRS